MQLLFALPPQDTLIATTMNTVMKETNSKPPSLGTPGIFSLSDENSLKNSFIMSGFKDLTIVKMNVSFDFKSPEDYTTFTSETVGPLQKRKGFTSRKDCFHKFSEKAADMNIMIR